MATCACGLTTGDAAPGLIVELLQFLSERDADRLAAAPAQNTIIVWDTAAGEALGSLAITARINSVSLTPDATKALSCDAQSIKWWDLTTLSLITELLHQTDVHNQFVVSRLSPDATRFAVADFSDVGVYNINGSLIVSIPNSFTNDLAFSPDGKTIAGCNETLVKLWDATTGKLIAQSPATSDYIIETISFSPDGTLVATGAASKNDQGADAGSVRVWSASALGLLATFSSDGVVDAVQFTNKSDQVLFDDADYNETCLFETVAAWEFGHNKLVGRPFAGHDGGIRGIATCKSDDTLVLSGSADDREVILWGLDTRQVIKRLLGHTNYVSCVDLSDDGKTAISGQYSAAFVDAAMLRESLRRRAASSRPGSQRR